MKFQILSHAGMLVEQEGISILFDPWLIGSCYWRSWWNFPEPELSLVKSLKPNYIYLTHLHWDHFHGPSLKLFSPDTKFIVPKIHTKRMVEDLEDLGFSHVIEIPHGSKLQLGNNFELYSYQFGPCSDSAALIKSKDVTLLNANDSKFFGFPLKQIINKFKKFDFIFRSHSSATAIPYCIQDYYENYTEIRTSQDYIDDFTCFALFLKTKYAIPFASNHCFLHKDTFEFNQLAVSPHDVQNYYKKKAKEFDIKSDCIVMPPGSSWDEENGFNIVPFDYDNKTYYIENLQVKYGPLLTNYYEQENRALANWNYFNRYFRLFLEAMPRFLFMKKNLKIIFKMTDAKKTNYWAIDFYNKSVCMEDVLNDSQIVIESSARIINDCVRKKMFSVWTASKRLKVHLANKDNLNDLRLFFTLLDLYELDLLPISRNFRWRALGIYFRRWREIIEFVHVIMKVKLLKKPFSLPAYYPLKSDQI